VGIGGGGGMVFVGVIGHYSVAVGVASSGVTGSTGGEVSVGQWWVLVIVAWVVVSCVEWPWHHFVDKEGKEQ